MPDIDAVERKHEEINKLFCKHHHEMYRIAYSVLNSREDAEDAVLAAFLHLLERPNALATVPNDKRTAFLGRCVKNCAIDLYRRNQRDIFLFQNECISDLNQTSDISESVINQESIQHLFNILYLLPAKYSVVILLKYRYHYTTAEIAHTLQANESTVRSWLYRAIQRLQRFIR